MCVYLIQLHLDTFITICSLRLCSRGPPTEFQEKTGVHVPSTVQVR